MACRITTLFWGIDIKKKKVSSDLFPKGSTVDNMRLCGFLDKGSLYVKKDKHGNDRLVFEVKESKKKSSNKDN